MPHTSRHQNHLKNILGNLRHAHTPYNSNVKNKGHLPQWLGPQPSQFSCSHVAITRNLVCKKYIVSILWVTLNVKIGLGSFNCTHFTNKSIKCWVNVFFKGKKKLVRTSLLQPITRNSYTVLHGLRTCLFCSYVLFWTQTRWKRTWICVENKLA